MSNRFIPANSEEAARERRLKKLIDGSTVSKTDTTKIEGLYAKFRDVCKQIGEMMWKPEFRGTYDEILELPPRGNDARLDNLVFQWQTLDSAIKVEATKLGYKGDKWMQMCWAEQ